jgi:hypothetical protein
MGESTQYTVNNQMVNATLMNIADNPTNVQLPGVYKNEEIPRVPVVCTGNDFSTLYAPLIRDGRMEKYYWNPTREDRIGVCTGIFQHDAVTRLEIESLVDAFPGQSIDFFGALRARVYDDSVSACSAQQPPAVLCLRGRLQCSACAAARHRAGCTRLPRAGPRLDLRAGR